jgi:hypothetical protein
LGELVIPENDEDVSPEILSAADAWYWAYHNKLMLQGGPFKLKGHEYQIGMMQCEKKVRCIRKAAQMAGTESEVLKTLHGMIYGHYPKGVLYLFPSEKDVSDFSKARFNPLIKDNPNAIGRYVQHTNAVGIKRIGTGMLYLRGARMTQKVEGVKKDSSSLRTVPVDKVVRDERDLMMGEMVDMSRERLSHSEVQEEVDVSTPTIPDFGIDTVWQASDQRHWHIKCSHCGEWTCLELEFPECVKWRKDGQIEVSYRACKKCGKEIHPRDGEWVPKHTDRFENPQIPGGFWISQLNSIYIDPGKLVEMYENPPNGNIQEVYNSKLGMPYIATEDRLTVQDIASCCGQDPIVYRDEGPCAMGVDVGKQLHVVIGRKVRNGQYKILYIGSFPDFNKLHDLGKIFGVRTAVLDLYPETRKVREFQKQEPYRVWGCQYRDELKDGQKRDSRGGVITVARTEICDSTHKMITDQHMIFPRGGSSVVEDFTAQLINIAKVLVEDPETGARLYRYKRLGPDHYRHALNYFLLAAQSMPVYVSDREKMRDKENSDWNPLTFGLRRKK